MFDEAHQPRLADLVEKGLDVAIEHPVDAPPADPERERIQRLVLIALRSEPVSEPQELRLIDRGFAVMSMRHPVSTTAPERAMLAALAWFGVRASSKQASTMDKAFMVANSVCVN